MEKEIINRIATSALISIDLESLYQKGPRTQVDMKDFLFQGIILKEKEFREQISTTDWTRFQGHFVSITCSEDAIIPTWAYMLLTVALQPHAKKIVVGTLAQLEEELFREALDQLPWAQYQNAKVVIKGCSDVQVPLSAYVQVTNRLRPITSSIMFGEPCSTVPLFKRKKSVD